MWGKKKKDKDSMTMNPDFEQDVEGDMINQAFNQQYQLPNLPSPQMPNMNAQNKGYTNPPMHQQQSFQQPYPVQQAPVQRFQPRAKIIKSEESVDNEYVYVVVTNYPLGLGDCQLTQ